MKKNSTPQHATIFLDIDDVLCVHRNFNTCQVLAALTGDVSILPETIWEEIFHANARQNLWQLHEEFHPRYVISSSWTLYLSREQLCDVFQKTGLWFVAENLHDIWCTPRSADSYRMTEIENWLDMQMYTNGPVLILDDELSGQSLVGSHLEAQAVLCDESAGFLHPNLVAAREILHRQSDGAGS